MNRCLKMDTSQNFLNISSPVPLIGSFAGELVLVTARVTTERTPGTCLYFSAAPQILPSSQPPIPCSEEGAGNATLSPRMAEKCVSVWSHEGLALTKLLTSVRASVGRAFINCPADCCVMKAPGASFTKGGKCRLLILLQRLCDLEQACGPFRALASSCVK